MVASFTERTSRAWDDTHALQRWKASLASGALTGLVTYLVLRVGFSDEAAMEEVVAIAAALLVAVAIVPSVQLIWNLIRADLTIELLHVQEQVSRLTDMESENERLRELLQPRARRIPAEQITRPLLESLQGYPYSYQVYAPYGDDEAHTFASDIDRVLRIAQWQGRGVVERQLYEGAPADGVLVWSAPGDGDHAGRLVDVLSALGFKVARAERDDYALGLSSVIEIHVRARP